VEKNEFCADRSRPIGELNQGTKMNRITLALAVTAAALAVPVARADTRIGFGVRIGSPIHRPAPPVVVYAPRAPTVVYAPPPVLVYSPNRGYWTDVTVKSWVPERWIVSRDRWGRSIRHCEPGYFTYRTERVWVDGRDVRHPATRPGIMAYGHRGR
jgi:hypothetical protein